MTRAARAGSVGRPRVLNSRRASSERVGCRVEFLDRFRVDLRSVRLLGSLVVLGAASFFGPAGALSQAALTDFILSAAFAEWLVSGLRLCPHCDSRRGDAGHLAQSREALAGSQGSSTSGPHMKTAMVSP
jgi:hypothetical protein